MKKQAASLLEQVNMEAIENFCRQIYFRDSYTAMHAEHVADLMAGLAAYMGMTSEEIDLAYMVGIVHDVGKIKIPDGILTKPGRLTDDEFTVMKTHAAEGAEILSTVEGAESIVAIMRHHHERYDGGGYPDGLKGEEIPLFSRMLALCDTFDAMTTARCYRKPVSLEQCLYEIRSCAGGQFDPRLCGDFINFIEERFGFFLDAAAGCELESVLG